MHDRAVNDALNASGRCRLRHAANFKRGQLAIDVLRQPCPQFVEVDGASFHDSASVAIVDQGQQKVLECRVLMRTVVRVFQCAVKCCFEAL